MGDSAQRTTSSLYIYLMSDLVIAQTRKWIIDVVIGCNFCPFAAKEIKRDSIHYHVEYSDDLETVLTSLINECLRLDENKSIETTLLILPESFTSFTDYLQLVDYSEALLRRQGYEGVYQVASFHPDYCFSGTEPNDASNYTNRSPYAMLQLLREESIEEALKQFPNPASIPEKNVQFTSKMGEVYMKVLREKCFDL